MKKILLMTTLLAPLSAITAHAGEITSPAIAAIEIAAPIAPDWGGFYIGATGGFAPNGAWNFADTGVVFVNGDMGDGQAYGGFVGYNIQRGNLVFGGEATYSGAGISMTGIPTTFFENFIDVRGRVGYSVNNVLVYATAGLAMADLNDSGSFFFDYTGFSYGVGADIMVTNRIFVGVEYLMRDMNGTDPTRSDITGHVTLGTIQARVGLKF